MSMSDDDIDDGQRDEALVGEYVLGLLDAADHALLARRIAFEPAMAAKARFWRMRLASLDTEFAEETAPAHILPRIEARVFDQQSKPSGFAALWENLALWRGLATAGLAVAVVAIGANILTPRALDPKAFAAQFVAALSEEGSNVKFVALYDGSGNVRLTTLSGDSVPDRDYELWAIQGANAPVSMGVVPVNQRTEVKLTPDLLAQFGAGSVLAVTLEPKGGSPTGGPTGPIVAKGVATSI